MCTSRSRDACGSRKSGTRAVLNGNTLSKGENWGKIRGRSEEKKTHTVQATLPPPPFPGGRRATHDGLKTSDPNLLDARRRRLGVCKAPSGQPVACLAADIWRALAHSLARSLAPSGPPGDVFEGGPAARGPGPRLGAGVQSAPEAGRVRAFDLQAETGAGRPARTALRLASRPGWGARQASRPTAALSQCFCYAGIVDLAYN